jgi:hypothetical protein
VCGTDRPPIFRAPAAPAGVARPAARGRWRRQADNAVVTVITHTPTQLVRMHRLCSSVCFGIGSPYSAE